MTQRRRSAAHPNDPVDRPEDVKAAFFGDDRAQITNDGTSSMFAPPVPDKHAVTEHRNHKFSGRRMAVGPLFDDEEIATLDTEFLQVPSRRTKDDFLLVDKVCRDHESLAGSTFVDRQTLRYLSGELKANGVLATLNSTLRHRCTSSSVRG